MMLKNFTEWAINPAYALLPEKMNTPQATTLLLAIALQESDLKYRAQKGGPARGYLMFEHSGGVAGVLKHHTTEFYAASACRALDYPVTSVAVYQAIEHNDILAAAFARLLLWTLPQPLAVNPGSAWEQYMQAWRPGKPHPERWEASWSRATAHVKGRQA